MPDGGRRPRESCVAWQLGSISFVGSNQACKTRVYEAAYLLERYLFCGPAIVGSG